MHLFTSRFVKLVLCKGTVLFTHLGLLGSRGNWQQGYFHCRLILIMPQIKCRILRVALYRGWVNGAVDAVLRVVVHSVTEVLLSEYSSVQYGELNHKKQKHIYLEFE